MWHWVPRCFSPYYEYTHRLNTRLIHWLLPPVVPWNILKMNVKVEIESTYLAHPVGGRIHQHYHVAHQRYFHTTSTYNLSHFTFTIVKSGKHRIPNFTLSGCVLPLELDLVKLDRSYHNVSFETYLRVVRYLTSSFPEPNHWSILHFGCHTCHYVYGMFSPVQNFQIT